MPEAEDNWDGQPHRPLLQPDPSPPCTSEPLKPGIQADARSALQLIERLLWEFDQRAKFLPPHYFADPVWIVLLDLYAHTLKRLRVSVGSLCIAARVPASTALRWIAVLVADGLIIREPDPEDKRRVYISLSPEGQQRVRACLDALSSTRENDFRTKSQLQDPASRG